MAKPYEHAFAGLLVALTIRRFGIDLTLPAFLIGSIAPDVDFLLLVPKMGRVRGHRTITHAPLFQLALAWLLRNYGGRSLLGGMFLHSIIDNFTWGEPPGIAWFWPFSLQRVQINNRTCIFNLRNE